MVGSKLRASSARLAVGEGEITEAANGAAAATGATATEGVESGDSAQNDELDDEYDDDECIIEKNDDDEVLLDDDFGGFNAFKSNERATKRRGKTNDDG